MKYQHISVLAKEAVDLLDAKVGRLYIDATAGGGGHSREIIRRGGKVLAIDRDEQAIEHLKSLGLKNATIVKGNFSHIENLAHKFKLDKVWGILFDLGLSSNQLESPQRGFSFTKSGPLDMRMDPDLTISASDLINNFEKRRLYELFQTYGQEKLSWKIADAIFRARQIKPIAQTVELAQIIREVYGKSKVKTKIDPATKVFQALRIVVNSELLNLEEALPQAEKLIERGGRLVIISFHSLEDAIVKRFFKQNENFKVLTKSPIGPTQAEIEINPRARSAKLRAAEKI